MNVKRRQEKKVLYVEESWYKRLSNFFFSNWTVILIVLNLATFLWLLKPQNRNIIPGNCVKENLDVFQSYPNPVKIPDVPQYNSQCSNEYYESDEIHLQTEITRLASCFESTNSFYKNPNNFFNFLPVRIFPFSQKKIISFSLYGSSDRYFGSIIKIIREYKSLLPDWIPRFWLGSDVPFVLVNRILHEGAEVIIVFQQPFNGTDSRKPSYHGMFWRFFVADDVSVERFIIRDADSLPIQREIDAVNQWVEERTMFHVMRDHPQHAIEILGGMWGSTVDLKIFNVTQLYKRAVINGFSVLDGRGPDQEFLKKYVWPLARRRMTCHISHRWKWVDARGCKDFPTKRVGNSYVGEIIKK